ncbi:MAG TPA: maleylacetoacetate isomerase [Steroidobacteraceae bacterium]|jgi:maleylacetoacetate isomerase|nr:maleylacetoacetate isomerase [Steroidobacteraceae bacterium]
MTALRLYTYFRSSAAYRVRIALNLKGLEYAAVPVHLLRDGGEQHAESFANLNPARLLPVLEDGAATITQSLAIIEYLEETHPAPPLLPAEAAARARVRALALSIACDIHPLNNLRVLRYLKSACDRDDAQREEWARHWIREGFDALERQLAGSARTGTYCHGETPSLADCCLVPQMANAQRVHLPLDGYPTLRRIHENCTRLSAFAAAAPAAQPDAE